MIKLETKIFKYGSFKEDSILEFNSDKEVIDYIDSGKEYTQYIIEKSRRCGESCSKWTESYTYAGLSYVHDLDI